MDSELSTQQPIETYESLASLLDFHYLAADGTTDSLAAACETALELALKSLVVRPVDVEAAQRRLRGSAVSVASVAGYPEGISSTGTKLYELRDNLRLGAQEVEFSVSPGKLLDRQYQHVEMELLQAARSCAEHGALLKVVVSNRYLTSDAKIVGAKICRRAEVGMISIDYADGETAVFRPLLKDRLLLKRATPLGSLEEALAMRADGYHRMAVTDPASILNSWKKQLAAREAEAGTRANLTPL